MLPDVTVGHA
jgi:hypothetical protein